MMQPQLVVVDDEVAHMRALCDTLGFEGYRVTGYNSPSQALQALSEHECDLLLTDLMMPEMDGIALIQAAREVNPDIAGVIMTGHGTIDTAVAALQVGALDYVLKPFRLNVILPVIARALDIRNLRIENASLQRREREHAIELSAAYRDLESFSYSISHDLRSPLRAVRGMTQIFLEEFGSGLPESGRHRLNQAIGGAERMDQMIEDLLRFCRLTRGTPQRSIVDMDAITQRTIDDLHITEPGRQIDVQLHPLPDCQGDPSLIAQVLSNLLSNAFKFTRGREDARIEVGSRRITLDEREEDVYFVRDNGAGFNMKYSHKLFGVFQRLHSEDQFPGTGVGLSIVKRIVERHGGRIWAESTPGMATTFSFYVGREP